MQNEDASLPDFALDAHAPAVRRDDVFNQTESQSVAANLRRLRLFAAIERLEDALLLGRRDAQPAIRDPDLNLFAVDRLYKLSAQPDPAAVAAVFHRVAEQVLNRAAQRGGVGFDRRQMRRDLSFDFEAAFGQLQMAGRDRVFNDLGQLGRPQFVILSPRLRAGEFQDLLDHPGQPAPFVANQSAVAFDLIAAVDHAVRQVFRRRTNHGQRRAQFVRDSGDEFHLLRREPLGAATGQHYKADARAQQQQNAEADCEIATARGRHGGFERTGVMFDDQPPRAFVIAVERHARNAFGAWPERQPPQYSVAGALVGLKGFGANDDDSMAVQRGRQLDRRVHIRASPLGEVESVGLFEENFEEPGRHVTAGESSLRDAGVREINNLIRPAALRHGYRVLSGAIAEVSSGQFGNQFPADVIGVERDDAIGPRARNRPSSISEAGADRTAGRLADGNDQPRQIFVKIVERQLKHHFLGGFATDIHFEPDGFAHLLLQQLISGAFLFQSFSQIRHAAGPFAWLESAGFGVVARKAPVVLSTLRLINFLDQPRARGRFAPAPVSRGEIVLSLIGGDVEWSGRRLKVEIEGGQLAVEFMAELSDHGGQNALLSLAFAFTPLPQPVVLQHDKQRQQRQQRERQRQHP